MMISAARLCAFVALTASLFADAASHRTTVNPGSFSLPSPNFSHRTTDSSAIFKSASTVNQKSGPAPNAKPDQPVNGTSVTVVDGKDVGSVPVDDAGSVQTRSIPGRLAVAARHGVHQDFTQVFAGTGTKPTDRDGSIEGTAYLTFTLVSNATYNVDDCLAFCRSVKGCVFANLYYEFNNPGLDAGSSNLKCAVYGDTHTAAEKTNRGGQNLGYGDDHLTFIQQSSGWANECSDLTNPNTPDGYELVFGPTNGANNAPGYMGFAFLDQYDVQACAQLCNNRGADPAGGVCQFFNIWRAEVNGNPTTYTCSMYFLPTNETTAVNFGQGDLTVTFSRGYKRITNIIDGGFEGFTCPKGEDTCFAESYKNWIGSSPKGGVQDILFFDFPELAIFGHSVATFGSGTGHDSLPGTIKPARPLATKRGATYTLQFFHDSSFGGSVDEVNSFLNVTWNGQLVGNIQAGFSTAKPFQFTVVAKGQDKLAFTGGAFPAYDFIDNVDLFLTY